MLYFKSFHVRSSQHRDKNDGWQHFLALLSSAGGHRWLPGDPGPCPPRCRGRVQQLPRQRPRPAAAPGGEREGGRGGQGGRKGGQAACVVGALPGYTPMLCCGNRQRPRASLRVSGGPLRQPHPSAVRASARELWEGLEPAAEGGPRP